jgi:hypothetical protein
MVTELEVIIINIEIIGTELKIMVTRAYPYLQESQLRHPPVEPVGGN